MPKMATGPTWTKWISEMHPGNKRYQAYLSILKEELVPASGCTEPVAVAFAGAKARDVLGRMPDRVVIEASPNIIKNAKSVIIPNTGGLKGMKSAAAAGIVAGDAGNGLQVITSVDDAQKKSIRQFLSHTDVTVTPMETDIVLDLAVSLYQGESSVTVRISHFHTHVVLIEKNGRVIYRNQDGGITGSESLTDRSIMNVKDIIEFAESVHIDEIEPVLQPQIDCNAAIAEAGLTGDWGANVGSVLLETFGTDIRTRAKAMAAAGSDARMGGCPLPVVIVSGSGNQGIAASVPVIVYATERKAEKKALFQALAVSNLITIHLKTGIGRLSAYCGVVSAGVGAGAGIAWLHGGRFKEIAHTIVNALAAVSGIVCDGAKPSCAAKMALAVEAGILGFHMYEKGQQFYGGDGIVKKGVENTIANIGRLGREGMSETDREIIRMMTSNE